jgi:release factor glutamine methyltransferase
VAPWTTLAVLDWTTQKFQDAKIGAARLEAQVLLAHALACKRIELYTNFDRPMSEPELATYRGLIRRRLAGEPLAYLVGEHEFWSLPFWVDASVLVPRADTETLIEVALARYRSVAAPADAAEAPPVEASPRRLLDLCTGSGAIVISLLHELPELTAVATDVSAAALAVAARNAARNGVSERLELRQGDLWAPVAGEQFDLIVSNPPYVATAVIDTLAVEVRNEPRIALDGGTDGLRFYDRIIAAAQTHLVAAGWLVLEHGFDQAEPVSQRLRDAGFAEIETVRDLGKNPRVTVGRMSADLGKAVPL